MDILFLLASIIQREARDKERERQGIRKDTWLQRVYLCFCRQKAGRLSRFKFAASKGFDLFAFKLSKSKKAKQRIDQQIRIFIINYSHICNFPEQFQFQSRTFHRITFQKNIRRIRRKTMVVRIKKRIWKRKSQSTPALAVYSVNHIASTNQILLRCMMPRALGSGIL